MNERTDPELLRDYAEGRSEAAFAELVRRHVDLVHSAALRMVRDTHLAEDVTQGVFAALARDARQLLGRPVLSGWLHRTARNLAANVVRAEVRRRAREQEAATMNELLADPAEPAWEQIAPLLDDALGELTDPDRDAVLLRYFERKSARDMAQLLGVSDEAAQKRVTRAVERLREAIEQRGVKLGAGGLAVAISANAVQAAPAGLALTISSTALAGATLATATAATAATTAKTIGMTTIQKTLVTATIAVLAGAGIYEARQATQLREQIASLRAEHTPLAEQLALLQRERENTARQLAVLRAENADLRRDTAELPRLRGEVARLRSESDVLRQTTLTLSNNLDRASDYGLAADQVPPIISSEVRSTAASYARLVQKFAAGQLTPAEEFHLLKAWPYLEARFHEPENFANFQSQYLAALLGVKEKDTIWAIRRVVEDAREKEHAYGLRWARDSEENIQRAIAGGTQLEITKIREEWAALDRELTQRLQSLLTEDQWHKLGTTAWPMLDFDPRLKTNSQTPASDSRFQNFTPDELFDSFIPPNPKVRMVPAKLTDR